VETAGSGFDRSDRNAERGEIAACPIMPNTAGSSSAGRLVVLGRSEERQQRQDCLFGTQLPQSTPSVCGSPHLAAGRSCLVQRGITGHADQVTDMLALKSEPRTIIKPPGRIVAVSLANTQ
jgi:hypothetical protein